MTDFVWPDDLVPYQVSFWLQPHTGRSESPFTRQQKIYGLSAPRWICTMSFRGGYDGTEAEDAFGPRLDAFVAKLKGGANRVAIYDFRRPGMRGGDWSFTAGNLAASAGATTLTITNLTPGALIFEGDYVGGDGRPHIIRDRAVANSAGEAEISFEPPLESEIAEDGAVFGNPTGWFRLISDDAGANGTSVGDLVIYNLEFAESLDSDAYLPTAEPGAAYEVVYSTDRVIAAYAGPLAATASTDLATSGDRISAAEVVAARGVDPVARVATWYDQTGNGHHATQADVAKRPALSESVTWNSRAPLLIDGKRSTLSNVHAVGLAATVALPGKGHTRFMVVDTTSSFVPQAFDASTTGFGRILNTWPLTPAFGDSGYGTVSTGTSFGKKVPSALAVIVARETPTGMDIFVNGVKSSTSDLAPADTPTAWYIGYHPSFPVYNSNLRLFAWGSITGDVSDAFISRLTAAMAARFRIPPGNTPIVTIAGDSIAEGVLSTYTRNGPFYWRRLLGQPVTVYNFGESGSTLATAYARRVSVEGEVYSASRRCVSILQGGINDLQGGTSGATLYSTVTTPYISYLKGLGFKVIVCTLLPQTVTNVETQRNAYNALVRANTAGADVICDLAADPVMGVYPTSPDDLTLYPDNIHPSSLGYSHLAPIFAAAVRQALS